MDRSGSNHNRWKGGEKTSSKGYVLIWVGDSHPMADCKGYALEHRLVMSEQLGRPLTASETVHHIDGNRSNNDISNLQLRIGNHGSGQAYYCCDCGSKRIGPIEL